MTLKIGILQFFIFAMLALLAGPTRSACYTVAECEVDKRVRHEVEDARLRTERQRSLDQQMDGTARAAADAADASASSGGLLGFLNSLSKIQRDSEDADTLAKVVVDLPRYDKPNRAVACRVLLPSAIQRGILSTSAIQKFASNCQAPANSPAPLRLYLVEMDGGQQKQVRAISATAAWYLAHDMGIPPHNMFASMKGVYILAEERAR